MKEVYKPLLAIGAVVAAMTAVVAVSRWLQPEERIVWIRDFTAAQREATAKSKPVLAYFSAKWCRPCEALKRTTWADAEVERAMAGYVPVQIDVDQNPAIAWQYNVEPLPRVILMTAQGLPM